MLYQVMLLVQIMCDACQSFLLFHIFVSNFADRRYIYTQVRLSHRYSYALCYVLYDQCLFPLFVFELFGVGSSRFLYTYLLIIVGQAPIVY